MLARILNTRVGFKDAVCFLFALLTVVPVFAENSIMKLFALFLGTALLIVMLRDRFVPCVYSLLCIAYLSVYLFKCLGNFDQGTYLSIALGVFKIVVFVLAVDWRLREDKASVFMPLFGFVMTALVFFDALTVLLFPDGLYRDSSGISQWVLGSKNNRLYWYVIDIALIVWNSRGKGKVRLPFVAAFLAFLEVSMLASASSTSAVALLLGIVAGVISIVFSKRKAVPAFSYFVVLAIYLGLNLLILGGSTGFLKDFVTGYLGKDLTFSDRTVIWGEVLALIQLKPEFGWGYLGNEATSRLLGRIDFVNAHNQILDSLLIGGVVLLTLFLITQLVLASNVAKSGDGSVRLLACGCGAALLMQMLFEQTLTLMPVWILFALLNGFCRATRSTHGGDSLAKDH